ncbi:MAG TPA: hypothetical protein DHV28_13405 [Ignavibacteriales bacterium]|nr:hypothetical protein [Ignavibacteriales bacterium]
MKIFCLFVPLFFFLLINSYSQDFGEIPEQLLKMTSLAEDPEEDAAVIFDKVSIKITRDFWLEIKRHVRIKVFSEEGKKEANIELVLWHEDIIDDIEAVSISPDGKEFELDSDNIFTEENEISKKISFPIPGVEIGSVFDYAYEVRSEYISHLEPWSFQSDIFTKYSEVKVYLPRGFAYQRLSTNLEYYDVQEYVEEEMDRDDTRKKLSVFTWSCTNLPGIKEEPFTDNVYDNYAKMRFVLVAFKNDYVDLKFAKSWDDVSQRIYKYYDNLINDDESEELVKSIIESETDDFKKANLIYDYVRSRIRTTEHKYLMGESFKEPLEVLNEKSGSTSEKSLLLINMLKNAGLDAKPVWISTRKNGKISVDFCDGSQFNRLICLLKLKNQNYFLYPSSASSPFGCLTPDTQIPSGLLIDGEKGSIIPIKPAELINSVVINTSAIIDSEMTLHANSRIQYSGYAATDERNAITTEDEETYIKDYLKASFTEAKLDSFYYTDLHSADNSLFLNLSFSITNYVEKIEQLGNFTMPFFTSLKENPFVTQRRSNPIDFDYPVLKSENVKIELPENYSVSQVPKKRKILLTDIGFSQVYGSGSNYVECARTLDLKNRRLLVKNYLSIKSLYDDLVSSSQDQIILTNKVDSTKIN